MPAQMRWVACGRVSSISRARGAAGGSHLEVGVARDVLEERRALDARTLLHHPVERVATATAHTDDLDRAWRNAEGRRQADLRLRLAEARLAGHVHARHIGAARGRGAARRGRHRGRGAARRGRHRPSGSSRRERREHGTRRWSRHHSRIDCFECSHGPSRPQRANEARVRAPGRGRTQTRGRSSAPCVEFRGSRLQLRCLNSLNSTQQLRQSNDLKYLKYLK